MASPVSDSVGIRIQWAEPGAIRCRQPQSIGATLLDPDCPSVSGEFVVEEAGRDCLVRVRRPGGAATDGLRPPRALGNPAALVGLGTFMYFATGSRSRANSGGRATRCRGAECTPGRDLCHTEP